MTLTTEQLVAGKGQRVEMVNDRGETVQGKLMSQQRNKQYTAFYVRIDGRDGRALVPVRQFTRFL